VPPSFSVEGAATGPYSGTFQEAGSWNVGAATPFSATFTITSGTATITGSKRLLPDSFAAFSCFFGVPQAAAADVQAAGYTATIHTPNGNFHDEGTFDVFASVNELGAAALRESFTSSLAEPVLIAPTSKEQCKNGGWKSFGTAFKNQGDCVSFVASGGKTKPSA
jgi:hypothetical protein